MATLGIIGIVSAVALPSTTRTMADLRMRADARNLHNTVALAKMRAAAHYSRERVFVDLTTNNYSLQYWEKASNNWTNESGTSPLGFGVGFGYGTIDAPPPDTQSTLGQSAACTDNAGAAIANTSCIVFNSRGIPIDPVTGTPTGDSALYVTDGTSTYAVTLSATPLIRLWSTRAGAADWVHR